jgi:hypothetical protein
MPDQKIGIPILAVSQILDKVTLVLTGSGLDRISIDDTLVILAVGRPLKDSGVPLVVPKATVVPVLNAGFYIIAKTPLVEEEGERGAFGILVPGKKISRRPQLLVNEKEVVGNPGMGPVALGDAVVRARDVQAFIRSLAEQGPSGESADAKATT